MKLSYWSSLILSVILLISLSPLLKPIYMLLLFVFSCFIVLPFFSFRFETISSVFLLFLVYLFLHAVFDLHFNDYSSDISFVGFYYFFACLLAYLLYSSTLKEHVFRFLEKFVLYLCVFSLFGVLIYTFIPNLIELFPSYQLKNLQHKTIFFTNFLHADGELVLRNSGFTSEPGVFQILICSFLIIHLYRNNHDLSFFTIAIYTLSLFFTYSTPGFISLILCFFYMFSKVGVKFKLILTSLLIISIPLLTTLFFYHVTVKLNPEHLSLIARFEPLSLILNNYVSILGYGNTFYDNNVDSVGFGSFDSYSQLLIRYGLFGLLLYIFILFFSFLRSKFIVLIVSIGFLGQTLWFHPLFLFIIVFSFSAISKHERKYWRNKIQSNSCPLNQKSE